MSEAYSLCQNIQHPTSCRSLKCIFLLYSLRYTCYSQLFCSNLITLMNRHSLSCDHYEQTHFFPKSSRGHPLVSSGKPFTEFLDLFRGLSQYLPGLMLVTGYFAMPHHPLRLCSVELDMLG